MPATRIKNFLDENQIKYTLVTHSVAYTAQDLASITHIPGREVAKTVILKVDGEFAMAVLPASVDVDLEVLQAVLEANRVRLAVESEFRSHFPDCETGAMPPFGNLYAMPVYVDESLTRDEEIAFPAGSHRELLRIAYADFKRLVNPKVLRFSMMHTTA